MILRALDPKTGKHVWEYPMTGSGGMWSGTVSTAGGVIFSGDDDGHMVALDAKSGKNLWHFNIGEMPLGFADHYSVDGRQYVAIASATAVFSFGLFEPVPGVNRRHSNQEIEPAPGGARGSNASKDSSRPFVGHSSEIRPQLAARN